MRKKMLRTITIVITISLFVLVGCGDKKETNSTQTEQQTKEVVAETTEESKETQTQKQTEVATQAPTENETQKSTEAPTQKPTEAPTQKPTEAPTQKPTAAPTQAPADAPIVKAIGTVDANSYKKAETAFEGIVKKLRKDGLVSSQDVCVTMDNTTVKVDITFKDTDTDLTLVKDASSGVYTLTLDFQCVWVAGLTEKVNGIERAPYNKELLLALLSLVSEQPQALFETIDKCYFSSYSLSDTDWTAVGDCYMRDGDYKYDVFCQFQICKTIPKS